VFMDTIGEMTLNPCNILASAIPKYQVFSKESFGCNFASNHL